MTKDWTSANASGVQILDSYFNVLPVSLDEAATACSEGIAAISNPENFILFISFDVDTVCNTYENCR